MKIYKSFYTRKWLIIINKDFFIKSPQGAKKVAALQPGHRRQVHDGLIAHPKSPIAQQEEGGQFQASHAPL